jgi:hypothetical protein
MLRNRNRKLLLGSLAVALATPAIFTSDKPLPSFYDNTLTGLIPDLYAGLNVVSRELVGFIPAVSRNTGAERAAVGENVRWPIAPAANVVDITPAMIIPTAADQVWTNGVIQITKAKAAEFGYVGEEQKGLNNGAGYLSMQAQQFAEGLRALTNLIEQDCAVAAMAAATRATGTAGTTPFATNLGDSAQLRKILDDNGAPLSDRQMVINTATGASLRTLAQLTKANEAADTSMLRQGVLLDLHGFAIGESAAAGLNHVKGTAASATTNAAGYAVGATVITLAAAGTGTLVPGDVIQLAGDTNKYVLTAGDADVSNGGTFTIAAPGLRVAIPAAATAITVLATYQGNVAFPRSAMGLAIRPPAKPIEGDAAKDSMMITDPRSGLTFEVSIYAGYRKIRFEVAVAWGVAALNPKHIALLLG